ncbi:MAG: DUF1833 domain-containing protein [Desulfovibrio sp.]|jgi:hypothetical protein|nr:DUF1833 domain-containing protein [Desulfovibrio sp.]
MSEQMSEMEELQAAIEEAYASAPSDVRVLYTLEFFHHAFTQPARVARWSAAAPEPKRFLCRIEDNAPYNPGEVVEFIGLPFDLNMPEKSNTTPGEFTFHVADVGYALDADLEAAALSGGIITAIFRVYEQGEELSGPAQVWPGIQVTSPRLDPATGDMYATGSILGWVNESYGEYLTPEESPALVGG